ncbi:hypothetical protein PE067_11960 [Paracoccus sp. DMF-8]|uniref:hypothetical protein n=1 Tax=Paracoccus sp. DMF-8 TaxID=3019445 RepID=UPI0023E7B7EA|nr:hypothetical protein [Paracoccus sp. DMF-8]MDF3606777.1 hypothetical protein [Paracoccus sp. DMF-8]
MQVLLHGSLMADRASTNREIERAFGLPDRSITSPESLLNALATHPPARVIWQGHGAAVAALGLYADRIEAALGRLEQFDLDID